MGDRHGQAQDLTNPAILLERKGDLDSAARHEREALALVRDIGDRPGEAAIPERLDRVAQMMRGTAQSNQQRLGG